MDFHQIQSSYTGSFNCSYAEDKCMLRFTRVFQPVSPKDIQKGMKIYDWQNSKYFALDLKEATALSNILKRILSGATFQDIQGKYGGIQVNDTGLSVSHFPQNGTSMFMIFMNTEGNNAGKLTVGFKLIQNKQTVFDFYLAVDNEDIQCFIKYLDAQSAYIVAMCAHDNITYAKKSQQQGGQQQGGGGYNNQQNSYGNQGSQKSGGYNNQGGGGYNKGNYNQGGQQQGGYNQQNSYGNQGGQQQGGGYNKQQNGYGNQGGGYNNQGGGGQSYNNNTQNQYGAGDDASNLIG